MNAPRVDLAQLLVQAQRFVELWRGRTLDDLDSLGPALDDLANAVEGYVDSHGHTGNASIGGVPIDDPVIVRPGARIELLVHQVLPRRGLHGVLILRNDSTVELDVVSRDGRRAGFPPSAVADLSPGDTVCTPQGVDWTRPRPVSDRELKWAQRLGHAAHRRGGDYLWAQRLPDGRGVFLMPLNGAGVQLSVGMFGELTFDGTWYYDAENADVGWRDALGWDVGQREPHSLKGVPR